MPKCRTKWSQDAVIAMTKKQLVMKDVAAAVGMTRQYTSSVVYGHVVRPDAIRRISEFLEIPVPDEFILTN